MAAADIMEPTIREATTQDYDALCDLIGQVDTLHRDSLPHMFQEPEGPVRSRDYILGSYLLNNWWAG